MSKSLIVISSSDEDCEDHLKRNKVNQRSDKKVATKSPNSDTYVDRSILQCSHAVYDSSCMSCGVRASVNSNVDLNERNNLMASHLHDLDKCIINIKGDGHCLPRAVFTGCKKKDLLPRYLNYKALLNNANTEIIESWSTKYQQFVLEEKEKSIVSLNRYIEDRMYYLSASVLDIVILALAEVSSVKLKIYYIEQDNYVNFHEIVPTNNVYHDVIELSFLNNHYNLVVNGKNTNKNTPPKQQLCALPVIIELNDSPCKNIKKEIDVKKEKNVNKESDVNNIQFKKESTVKKEKYIYKESDVNKENDFPDACMWEEELSDYEEVEEDYEEVEFKGGKKYINPKTFTKLDVIVADSVPSSIDGVVVYRVPIQNKLDNCKGSRPWGLAKSSKTISFNKGPRLRFDCRGSYICKNMSCRHINNFGINRTDFIKKGNSIICSICSANVDHIPCDCSLIIEKNIALKVAEVKHYGTHTCPLKYRGRPPTKEIESLLTENPKLTRETIIRQKVSKKIELSDFNAAVTEAQRFTDTKYLDNKKYQVKKLRRPDGHSFRAVEVVKEAYDPQDKFLIFNTNDGVDGKIPFVIKSSKKKVYLMLQCDKDKNGYLSSETVHLDVVHSRCKGWKTYTLSYYDSIIQSMVKLATMEKESECSEACEIFFTQINKMLRQYETGSTDIVVFNPYHLKDDEHGGNKIGMRAVLGEAFVRDRTSSCEYHFDASVKRHRKYCQAPHRNLYSKLCSEMKNAVSKNEHEKSKSLLEDLILQQAPGDQKPLNDALKFWEKCRYRWAVSYRSSLHQIPKSSLAEAAHASMKAAGDKNLSLIDAVYSDMTDAARLEAKWLNRETGESTQGSGPSSETLAARDELRQVDRANKYISAVTGDQGSFSSEESDASETLPSIFDGTRSHRPDKKVSNKRSTAMPVVKSKRKRSETSAYFKTIISKSKKAMEQNVVKVTELRKDAEKAIIKMRYNQQNCTVTIAEEVLCSCSNTIRANRKICQHILWVYINIASLQENNAQIAQVSISSEELSPILDNIPDTIPESLKTCNDSPKRTYHESLKKHSKFNDAQEWYVDIKSSRQPCRCSGCLVKAAIKTGSLHFYVKGLLYLANQDKVVETKLRFCPHASCVQNINSSYHNIKPFASMVLKKDPSLTLDLNQQANLQAEGFTIQGMNSIDFS